MARLRSEVIYALNSLYTSGGTVEHVGLGDMLEEFIEEQEAEQTLFLKTTGANTPLADIPWAGFKITGLGDGTNSGDAINFGQFDAHAGATTSVHGIVDTSDLVLKSGSLTQLTTRSHADLQNLSNDDHSQYMLVTGARSFSGVVSGITPTLPSHLVTKDYVDAAITGLNWQDQVLSRWDASTGLPVPITTLDRYLCRVTGNGWTLNYIYQWNGSSWDEEIPHEGWAVWIVDENYLYVFNGTAWVLFGSAISHSSLQNLTADDHLQYLLTTGARALTGDQSFGNHNATNVLGIYFGVAGATVNRNSGYMNIAADPGFSVNLGTAMGFWPDATYDFGYTTAGSNWIRPRDSYASRAVKVGTNSGETGTIYVGSSRGDISVGDAAGIYLASPYRTVADDSVLVINGAGAGTDSGAKIWGINPKATVAIGDTAMRIRGYMPNNGTAGSIPLASINLKTTGTGGAAGFGGSFGVILKDDNSATSYTQILLTAFDGFKLYGPKGVGGIGSTTAGNLYLTPSITGNNEKQEAFLEYIPTSGTFTFTFSTQTTTAIQWNADAAAVTAALEALAAIGSGNVSVMIDNPRTTGQQYNITFQGTKAGQNLPPIIIDVTNLRYGANLTYQGWMYSTRTWQDGGYGSVSLNLNRTWSMTRGSDNDTLRFVSDGSSLNTTWEFVNGAFTTEWGGRRNCISIVSPLTDSAGLNLQFGFGPWDNVQPGIRSSAWLSIGTGNTVRVNISDSGIWYFSNSTLNGNDTVNLGGSSTSGRFLNGYFKTSVGIGRNTSESGSIYLGASGASIIGDSTGSITLTPASNQLIKLALAGTMTIGDVYAASEHAFQFTAPATADSTAWEFKSSGSGPRNLLRLYQPNTSTATLIMGYWSGVAGGNAVIQATYGLAVFANGYQCLFLNGAVGQPKLSIYGDQVFSTDGSFNIGYNLNAGGFLRPNVIYSKSSVRIGTNTGESGSLYLGATGAYITNVGGNIDLRPTSGGAISPQGHLAFFPVDVSDIGYWNSAMYRPRNIYAKGSLYLGTVAGESSSILLGGGGASIGAASDGSITFNSGTPNRKTYVNSDWSMGLNFNLYWANDTNGYIGYDGTNLKRPQAVYIGGGSGVNRGLNIGTNTGESGYIYLGPSGAAITGSSGSTNIAFNGQLKSVTDPTDPQDAATRSWVLAQVPSIGPILTGITEIDAPAGSDLTLKPASNKAVVISALNTEPALLSMVAGTVTAHVVTNGGAYAGWGLFTAGKAGMWGDSGNTGLVFDAAQAATNIQLATQSVTRATIDSSGLLIASAKYLRFADGINTLIYGGGQAGQVTEGITMRCAPAGEGGLWYYTSINPNGIVQTMDGQGVRNPTWELDGGNRSGYEQFYLWGSAAGTAHTATFRLYNDTLASPPVPLDLAARLVIRTGTGDTNGIAINARATNAPIILGTQDTARMQIDSTSTTLSGHLIFSADGSYNIGSADGGTTKLRPDKIWSKTSVTVGNSTVLTDGLLRQSDSNISPNLEISAGDTTTIDPGTLTLSAGATTYGSAQVAPIIFKTANGVTGLKAIVGRFTDRFYLGQDTSGLNLHANGQVSIGGTPYFHMASNLNLFWKSLSPYQAGLNLDIGSSGFPFRSAYLDTSVTVPAIQAPASSNLTLNPASGKEVVINTGLSVLYATVPTIDNSPTPLVDIPSVTDKSMFLEVRVTAQRTSGSAGSDGDSAVYIMKCKVKNVSGTVTIADIASETQEDQDWNADVVVSGTDARIEVTGATNNNITWKATIFKQVG